VPTYTDTPGYGHWIDYVPNSLTEPGNWIITMLDGNDRVIAVVDPGKNPVTHDRIDLGEGDDTVWAADGADTVIGGAGDDEIYTDDWGIGGTGDTGRGAGADQASGDGGNDYIHGGGGADSLHGNDDNDYVLGGEGADTLFGDDGIDSLYADDWYDADHAGDRAFDVLRGGAGDDALYRGRNGDQLYGEDGNDLIEAFYVAGQAGVIRIDGGGQNAGGQDVLRLAYSGDVDVTFVFGANGSFTGTGVNISGIERLSSFDTADGDDRITLSSAMSEAVRTGAGNDTITGGNGGGSLSLYDDIVDTGDGHDVVNAGGGSDWVTNRGGEDTIDAGDGDDFVVGYGGATSFFGQVSKGAIRLGGGSDVFYADYNVWEHLPVTYSVAGEAGNDLFIAKARGAYVFKPGTGNDRILASGTGLPPFNASFSMPSFGSDPAADDARRITLDYSDLSTAVVVDLDAGAATSAGKSDAIARDPSAGGLFSLVDDVVGTDKGDSISGDGSANVLAGAGGDDVLVGGGGDDRLDGGEDAGGKDRDIASYADAGATVTVNLAAGTATGEGADTLAGIEDVVGSVHNDKLTGDAGDNALEGLGGLDTLDGGNGNDNLSGGDANDRLVGGGGKDVLAGGAGNDSLDGGDGEDLASYAKAPKAVAVSLFTGRSSGGDGNDTLVGIEAVAGSRFNDTLTGGAGDETLSGGKGDDELDGGAGANRLDGGQGRDLLRFDSRPVKFQIVVDLSKGTASAGDGSSTVEGIEDVLGGSKDDLLTGDGEDNRLVGGAGDDELAGGAGDDELDGGAGSKDDVSYAGADAKIKASLATGRATGEGSDTLIGVEYLIGSSQNDTLTGNGDKNRLWGNAGADLIDGGASSDELSGGTGNDTVKGGAGSDYIEGGKGADTLSGGTEDDFLVGDKDADSLAGDAGNDGLAGGDGDDKLSGGSGDDALYGDAYFKPGGQAVAVTPGDDRLDGGAGRDTVGYAASKTAVDASLDRGRATGEGNDTLVDIEALGGSRFNDTLEGSSGDNILAGLAGDDSILGLAGNDTIIGSAGADTVDGGAGTDVVIFDSALKLQVRGLSGNVMEVVFGSGEARGDVYANIERFEGSPDADTLSATGSNGVRLAGGEGNDRIAGAAGGDRLFGDVGNDLIDGKAGDDTLDGGLGRDTLIGGLGSDAFLFSTPPDSTANRDRIGDFDPTEDIVQLARGVFGELGPKGALDPGSFFVGAAATKAQHHVVYDASAGVLLYDSDGKGGRAAVAIVDIGKNLDLTAADMFVV